MVNEQRIDVRKLFPVVYGELRELAARQLRSERPGHTLQPTALVHEAFLRLVHQDRVDWRGATHLKAVAAEAMRRVLVDHARAASRKKRGGKLVRTTLSGIAGHADLSLDMILTLDDALRTLARQMPAGPRLARLVELVVFGGFSITEAASKLDVSRRQATRDWRYARVWLFNIVNTNTSVRPLGTSGDSG